MFRLILFLSLFPIAIALVARWWFGARVLAARARAPAAAISAAGCPRPAMTALIHRAEESAGEFGRQLRLKALAEWQATDPKAARSRENTRRFGLAVPPLSGVVAVFAVLVGKIPVMGAVTLFCSEPPRLSALLGLLSLPPELAPSPAPPAEPATTKVSRISDDEEAVIRCAIAHAWDAALPPVMRGFHKSSS